MVRRVIFITGLLVLLLPAAGALAGGWVVITLETMPGQIYAGQPAQISFMVRQHGRTPIHSVEPMVTATNPETGERIQVKAEAAAELGRYTAAIDFPSAGAWEWSIIAEPFPQTATFAPLAVLDAEPALMAKQADQLDDGELTAGTQPMDQAGFDVRPLLRVAGMVLLAVALLLFSLDRWRRQATGASTPTE
jgi:hypothetical protein